MTRRISLFVTMGAVVALGAALLWTPPSTVKAGAASKNATRAAVKDSAMSGGAAAESPETQKLEVSLGKWVFHGTTKDRSGKTGTFTWNEDCQWSPNHLFLECMFSNVWSGKPVESLVVDTYNSTDKNYWHYEFYASGEKGNDPFVSRMEVNGDTWIEHGRDAVPGKTSGERIVYNWGPPGHVKVAIETSKDGTHWEAVDQGEGVRQK